MLPQEVVRPFDCRHSFPQARFAHRQDILTIVGILHVSFYRLKASRLYSQVY